LEQILDHFLLPPIFTKFSTIFATSLQNTTQRSLISTHLTTQLKDHNAKILDLWKNIILLVCANQGEIMKQTRNMGNADLDPAFLPLFVSNTTNRTILTTLIEFDILDNLFLRQVQSRIRELQPMMGVGDSSSTTSPSDAPLPTSITSIPTIPSTIITNAVYNANSTIALPISNSVGGPSLRSRGVQMDYLHYLERSTKIALELRAKIILLLTPLDPNHTFNNNSGTGGVNMTKGDGKKNGDGKGTSTKAMQHTLTRLLLTTMDPSGLCAFDIISNDYQSPVIYSHLFGLYQQHDLLSLTNQFGESLLDKAKKMQNFTKIAFIRDKVPTVHTSSITPAHLRKSMGATGTKEVWFNNDRMSYGGRGYNNNNNNNNNNDRASIKHDNGRISTHDVASLRDSIKDGITSNRSVAGGSGNNGNNNNNNNNTAFSNSEQNWSLMTLIKRIHQHVGSQRCLGLCEKHYGGIFEPQGQFYQTIIQPDMDIGKKATTTPQTGPTRPGSGPKSVRIGDKLTLSPAPSSNSTSPHNSLHNYNQMGGYIDPRISAHQPAHFGSLQVVQPHPSAVFSGQLQLLSDIDSHHNPFRSTTTTPNANPNTPTNIYSLPIGEVSSVGNPMGSWFGAWGDLSNNNNQNTPPFPINLESYCLCCVFDDLSLVQSFQKQHVEPFMSTLAAEDAILPTNSVGGGSSLTPSSPFDPIIAKSLLITPYPGSTPNKYKLAGDIMVSADNDGGLIDEHCELFGDDDDGGDEGDRFNDHFQFHLRDRLNTIISMGGYEDDYAMPGRKSTVGAGRTNVTGGPTIPPNTNKQQQSKSRPSSSSPTPHNNALINSLSVPLPMLAAIAQAPTQNHGMLLEVLGTTMGIYNRLVARFLHLLNHYITIHTFPSIRLHLTYALPLPYRQMTFNCDEIVQILYFQTPFDYLYQYLRKCSLSFNWRLATIPKFSTRAFRDPRTQVQNDLVGGMIDVTTPAAAAAAAPFSVSGSNNNPHLSKSPFLGLSTITTTASPSTQTQSVTTSTNTPFNSYITNTPSGIISTISASTSQSTGTSTINSSQDRTTNGVKSLLGNNNNINSNKTNNNGGLNNINGIFSSRDSPNSPSRLTIFQRVVHEFGPLALIDPDHPVFGSLFGLLLQGIPFDHSITTGCQCPHCRQKMEILINNQTRMTINTSSAGKNANGGLTQNVANNGALTAEELKFFETPYLVVENSTSLYGSLPITSCDLGEMQKNVNASMQQQQQQQQQQQAKGKNNNNMNSSSSSSILLPTSPSTLLACPSNLFDFGGLQSTGSNLTFQTLTPPAPITTSNGKGTIKGS
jgi:hypothetical protein